MTLMVLNSKKRKNNILRRLWASQFLLLVLEVCFDANSCTCRRDFECSTLFLLCSLTDQLSLFPVGVHAEEAAQGLVWVWGVRSQVQSDVSPEGSSSDSHRWKHRCWHAVPLVSTQQHRLGATLFRVWEKVLLGNPPPQPHPNPALKWSWGLIAGSA